MTIIVKATVVGRLEPGRYPLYGSTHLRWWIGNLFMRFGQQTIWAPLGRSGLGRWLLRSFGARMGIKTTAPIGGSIPSFSLIDATCSLSAPMHMSETMAQSGPYVCYGIILATPRSAIKHRPEPRLGRALVPTWASFPNWPDFSMGHAWSGDLQSPAEKSETKLHRPPTCTTRSTHSRCRSTVGLPSWASASRR